MAAELPESKIELHPVVRAAAEAIRQAAPAGPVDGLVVHAAGTPESVAAVVAPAVLRWAAPHLEGRPLHLGAYDGPVGSDWLRIAAAEIEASGSPEGDTRDG